MQDNYYDKWIKSLRLISIGLYIAVILLEGGMYFVLRSQNLIYQSTADYLWSYFLKPVLISTAIVAVGATIIQITKKEVVKKYTQLIMITLMFGNVAYIHSVFLVAMVVFCIPIFLTVVFQDKKLLNVITILSELIVLRIAVHGFVTGHGAGRNEYFLPSVIIAMVLLFACRCIAGVSITVLNDRNAALQQATLEAQEAREQAELANQGKTIFLSNMSHEIRTPINAVLGLDEMIIRESEEETIRDYAMDIKSSGKSLLALVNDVLDFSKIESGKLELVNTEYDVSSVINDLVNMISARAIGKGLSFMVDVKPEVPHLLFGDEVRIKQIILNLLTNAVKYTDKGTVTLTIDYSKVDNEKIKLLVSVKDTGKGIKEADMEKLFVPFERIEEKRNRNIEGTGLGMSITKQLLALMDSELQVDSVYGKGSNFTFEIIQGVRDWKAIGNYQEAYRRQKSLAIKYKEQFRAPKARILVVDDTVINLKVFSGLLKKTEVMIDEAHSGEECLNFVSENDYHIIFIDHMMPDMDGIETLRRIKEMDSSKNSVVPTIALTANATSGSREFYLKSGFTEYLTKPIEPLKLEQMLIRFLPEELVELTEE